MEEEADDVEVREANGSELGDDLAVDSEVKDALAVVSGREDAGEVVLVL